MSAFGLGAHRRSWRRQGRPSTGGVLRNPGLRDVINGVSRLTPTLLVGLSVCPAECSRSRPERDREMVIRAHLPRRLSLERALFSRAERAGVRGTRGAGGEGRAGARAGAPGDDASGPGPPSSFTLAHSPGRDSSFQGAFLKVRALPSGVAVYGNTWRCIVAL